MKLILIYSFVFFTDLALATDKIVFNDPLFNKQWALKNTGQTILKNISDLERIRIEGVSGKDIHWVDTSAMLDSNSNSKAELIVAVLDSGMDINHPDLFGRTWYNKKICENATNAKILPCYGFNFLDGNNNILDDVGHGTHVAGIIAANKNAIGIVGAADPRIKIMPIKVLNSQVSGFVYNGKLITDVIADAMIFAINNGAKVINLSLGWPKLIDTIKVHQAFDLAEAKNIIVIAAAGNNNKDLPTFPCAYENVVCVGAIDNRGELTDFSNHGSKVDLVAPGEYILSTIPRNLESRVMRISQYDVKRGSSQAAPFVTAAVANLKLLHPEFTNDKVRSLLFKSASPLIKSKNNRFVKFGSLDMKNLLDLANEVDELPIVIPEIKGITEIKYQMLDRKFNFNLPLKNLSNLDFNGIVCINASSSIIDLEQNCFEVKELKAHSITNLLVNGSLVDLSKDAHVKFTIQVDQNVFETNLVFSRDLNDDHDLSVEAINGASFDDMAILTADRKLSKMVKVFDKHHRLNYPEYFYLEKSKQSSLATVVSLLTKENGKYIVKSITLPLVNRVLSIHRQDLNFDGIVDTFIYCLSAKKDELLFFNLDRNLSPLFGKYSKWSMGLSTFEGLPIEGGVERFNWFKIIHSQLGAILVPSFVKNYTMPEVDNSKNLLDRITSNSNHHYYLNPKLDSSTDSMKIELRVIDSVLAMKKIRSNLRLYSDQSISLLRSFPQTYEQNISGEIHSLASIDSGSQKVFIELILNSNTIEIKSINKAQALETAFIYPVINSVNGNISNKSILTSLLNRSNAEFILKNQNDLSAPLMLKQDFENPIIGLISAYESYGEVNYFVENRSTVSFLRQNGERKDLPVYRDSSFAGQNFSETLIPILVEGLPGVFVNSTLIYGDRLYSMIGLETGFIRPLRLSVEVPKNCVPLNPEVLEEKANYNYVFLCSESDKRSTLKFLPMLEH